MITNTILKSKHFAGIHFTGSTSVFKGLWKKIGANIENYNSYPRIVGETGGKDFVVAHPTADPKEVATAVVRGAFEFQGQKCSAASRIYLPKSIGDEVIRYIKSDLKTISMGSPENFKNFITAVIHKEAFDRIAETINRIKESQNAKIVFGGNYNDKEGFFIEPTVVLTEDPQYETMSRELFGPLVTFTVLKTKIGYKLSS